MRYKFNPLYLLIKQKTMPVTSNQDFKKWYNSLPSAEKSTLKSKIIQELMWEPYKWKNVMSSASKLDYSQMLHIADVVGVPVVNIFHHLLLQPKDSIINFEIDNNNQSFIALNKEYSTSLDTVYKFFQLTGWELRSNYHSWEHDTCAIIKLLEAAKMTFVKFKCDTDNHSVQNQLLDKIDRLGLLVEEIRCFYKQAQVKRN